MLFILFLVLFIIKHIVSGSLTPPIIDVSALLTPELFSNEQLIETQQLIVSACHEWGFFHITNHGISIDLVDPLMSQMRLFFNSDKELKYTVKRSPTNSRGFADDELTKQLKDSKEVLDIGQVHFVNLSAKATEDQLLDGHNLWPMADHLTHFKPAADAYYNACLALSSVIFRAIVSELVCKGELPSSVTSAFDTHSSFLRLNMYPLVEKEVSLEPDSSIASLPAKLGVSRHTDAGVLTLLLQDGVPALEVYSGSKQDFGDGEWVAVDPVSGALTVNTGDMLQVWSNGYFKAPEHRVRASRGSTVRYSAPFFYNPAYDTLVAPILCDNSEGNIGKRDEPKYTPIRWGDYRTQRFIGDYTDAGEEIQIEVFSSSS